MAEAVLGRRERKKEETKRRIFVAALELFHDKGFDATTVDEITERADVAKGTFFNYFPRKESVLEFLNEDCLERAEEHALAPGASASERVIALCASVAEAYGQNRALARMLLRVSMEKVCCPEPERGRNRLEQLAKQVFEEGQKRGEFRADLDAESVFRVLGSVFIGALLWWAADFEQHHRPPGPELMLQDVVRQQLTVVFDGLRAPAPQRKAREG